MTDNPMISGWIQRRLNQAVEGYLKWMAENGYSESTQKAHKRGLNRFRAFINKRKYSFDQIFTKAAIWQFKKTCRPDQLNAIYGLARYLFDQKKISRRVSAPTTQMDLPKIYEDYLFHDQQQRQWADRNAKQNRRVLCAFYEYLLKENIDLKALSIEDVDAFFARFFAPFKPSSQRAYRSKIRGFLT